VESFLIGKCQVPQRNKNLSGKRRKRVKRGEKMDKKLKKLLKESMEENIELLRDLAKY